MVVEQWIEREIARGLQGLIALRLPGAPGDDSVTKTLDVWLAAVAGLMVAWTEERDAERIRASFRTLYRICDRWPAPKLFVDNLGNRDPPRGLPPPQMSAEERARNKQRLQEMLEQLGKRKLMIKGE